MTRLRVAILEAFGPVMQTRIQDIVGPDFDLIFPASNSEEDRITALANVRYAVVRAVKMPASMLDAAPDLALLHQWGTGTDGLPVPEALAKGLTVASSPGKNAASVADHTVGLMLSVMKRICVGDARVRAGDWLEPGIYEKGRDLNGATVGLVGFGAIAQCVARRLSGFDCQVLYTRRSGALEGQAGHVSFDELITRSDVVSLHAPLTEATRHLINEDTLARMKKGAFLVNTARGGVVDQDALLRALEVGHIAGAALDVFDPEPLPLDHPLRSAPNTVLTPHMSGGTQDNLARIVGHWAQNVRKHAEGAALDQGDLVTA